MTLSARERIRRVVERWFLVEPLFLAVWTAHALCINPRIRTIRVGQGQIEFNPEFIEGLDRRQLEEVLELEALRIVLKHPYSRRRQIPELSYAASNLTLQECLRTRLPLPRARDVFGHERFDRQYFEFYYNQLVARTPPEALGTDTPAGDDSAEDGSRDSGDRPPAARPASPAEARSEPDEPEPPGLETYADPAQTGVENAGRWDRDELLVDTIDDHIRTARDIDSWGTIAGRLRERILAGLRPALDARALLRQFRASIRSVDRRLTRMKPNRRYGFQYLGSRYDDTTRLLFAVDVSGSMGTDDLRHGFAVVNQLFRVGLPTVDVVQFDTELKGPPTTWKRARRELEVLGRGGTDFQPVIDWLEENPGYDGAVIFTDGCAPAPRPRRRGLGTHRATRLFWLFNSESSYQEMAPELRRLGRAAYLKASRVR